MNTHGRELEVFGLECTSRELITLIRLLEPLDGYQQVKLSRLRCVADSENDRYTPRIYIDTLHIEMAGSLDSFCLILRSLETKRLCIVAFEPYIPQKLDDVKRLVITFPVRSQFSLLTQIILFQLYILYH